MDYFGHNPFSGYGIFCLEDFERTGPFPPVVGILTPSSVFSAATPAVSGSISTPAFSAWCRRVARNDSLS